MGMRRTSLVQRRQDPLRARYRSAPAEAWISDAAQTISACGGDAFHGVVVPDNSVDAPLQFGIHRAVGGFHDYPNPGDLLSASLAACFDSTLRMIAEHLGIPLESLEVKVDAECDVRGCLLVEPAVAVGFQRMRCSVRLQTKNCVDEDTIKRLVAAAEHSCVVMQTLRNGVSVQTQVERNHAAGAMAAV
ncbi:MAG TPA: OsmC family protein [Casimicrobiaceae bacterium]|nr:OsmC family protein [Casimicrobiaceae bacterium]